MGFLAGVRVGSGLAAAAFIMAVTFGATVRAQGWGLLAPVICSLVVFSGSAQFTLATALAGGGGPGPPGPVDRRAARVAGGPVGRRHRGRGGRRAGPGRPGRCRAARLHGRRAGRVAARAAGAGRSRRRRGSGRRGGDGMTLWIVIVAVAALSFAIKAAGPALLGERQLPAWARRITALLASALLAGLIVVHLRDSGWSAVTATVVGGLAVTAGARLLKAPMLLAVVGGGAGPPPPRPA